MLCNRLQQPAAVPAPSSQPLSLARSAGGQSVPSNLVEQFCEDVTRGGKVLGLAHKLLHVALLPETLALAP
jgi:hypothetical protein